MVLPALHDQGSQWLPRAKAFAQLCTSLLADVQHAWPKQSLGEIPPRDGEPLFSYHWRTSAGVVPATYAFE